MTEHAEEILKEAAHDVLKYFAGLGPQSGDDLSCHLERQRYMKLSRERIGALVQAGAMENPGPRDNQLVFKRNVLEALAGKTLAELRQSLSAEQGRA